MRINIRVRHTDLLEQVTSVLAEGPAEFDGRLLSFPEKPPFSGWDRVEFSGEEIRLFHEGETSSTTRLPLEGMGKAVVKTPYGTMELAAVLTHLKRAPHHLEMEYEILQNGEKVSHFRLEYDITDRFTEAVFPGAPC